MTANLAAVCFAARDPRRLARFWADFLGRELTEDGVALLPDDDTGFRIRFVETQEQKTGKNLIHFDLTSTSPDDQRRTVARSIELGGRHIDIGQRREEEHVVLADPEGNEFCVVEPGNNFLAGCGFLGAVSCDGSQEVGYFWSRALDWPLVWDRDQETAIRSPRGGSKISWGGEEPQPKTDRNRVHFDLTPRDGDQQAEVDRLSALGATRIRGESGLVEMTDPDGNEFCVLTSH